MISRTTKAFWKRHDSLPTEVRRQAAGAYQRWRNDPNHPSLQFKCVSERHGVFSLRVGLHWRALGYRETSAAGDVMTWFWIGSHAEYDRLVGAL